MVTLHTLESEQNNILKSRILFPSTKQQMKYESKMIKTRTGVPGALKALPLSPTWHENLLSRLDFLAQKV